jgi:predicted PurR-regulated permease PerM
MKNQRNGLNHPLIWAGVILLTLLLVVGLYMIWWLALPTVLSVVFYYSVQPGISFLKHRGWTPSQALWGVIGLVSLFLIVAVPSSFVWLVGQVEILQANSDEYTGRINGLVAEGTALAERKLPFLAKSGGASLQAKIDKGIDEAFSHYAPTFLVSLMTWIPSLLLVPYIAFFMLRDGAAFKKMLMRGVPNAFFEKVLLLFHRIDGQIKRFFVGLMGMTVLDTVTLALGLWILGKTYGGTVPIFPLGSSIFFGLMCAMLSWVPFVGSVIGCVIIVLVCLIQVPGDWTLIGLAIMLFCFVRLLDDFIYTPLTVGRSLESHPLLTVVMIFAGGVAAGVPGLFLAMPMLGVCMVLGEIFGQVWQDERLRARHEYAIRLRRFAARTDLELPNSRGK